MNATLSEWEGHRGTGTRAKVSVRWLARMAPSPSTRYSDVREEAGCTVGTAEVRYGKGRGNGWAWVVVGLGLEGR